MNEIDEKTGEIEHKADDATRGMVESVFEPIGRIYKYASDTTDEAEQLWKRVVKAFNKGPMEQKYSNAMNA